MWSARPAFQASPPFLPSWPLRQLCPQGPSPVTTLKSGLGSPQEAPCFLLQGEPSSPAQRPAGLWKLTRRRLGEARQILDCGAAWSPGPATGRARGRRNGRRRPAQTQPQFCFPGSPNEAALSSPCRPTAVTTCATGSSLQRPRGSLEGDQHGPATADLTQLHPGLCPPAGATARLSLIPRPAGASAPEQPQGGTGTGRGGRGVQPQRPCAPLRGRPGRAGSRLKPTLCP